jgi:hypothetical protein
MRSSGPTRTPARCRRRRRARSQGCGPRHRDLRLAARGQAVAPSDKSACGSPGIARSPGRPVQRRARSRSHRRTVSSCSTAARRAAARCWLGSSVAFHAGGLGCGCGERRPCRVGDCWAVGVKLPPSDLGIADGEPYASRRQAIRPSPSPSPVGPCPDRERGLWRVGAVGARPVGLVRDAAAGIERRRRELVRHGPEGCAVCRTRRAHAGPLLRARRG